jgi:hypothetical protein
MAYINGKEVLFSPSITIGEGYDKGFEEGKKAEYDAFWNGLQNNGERNDYSYAFASWGAEYIRPKYKVIPTAVTGAANTFLYCNSLKKIESQYFDFSQKPYATGYNRGYDYLCANCVALEEIEDIGLVPQITYQYAFTGCHKLKTIAKLCSNENTTFTGAFDWCNALENITIEGTIGKSISFAHCPLTYESMKSIISHLKQLMGAEHSQTITFSQACWDLLEEHNEECPMYSYNGYGWRQMIGSDLYWATS